MKSHSIRRAGAQDEQSVLECLRVAFEPFRQFYSPEGFADTTLTPATYQQRLRRSTIFVAEERGEVIGTIACNRISEEEGHLRGMAVLPDHQGAGVAQSLLDAAETEIERWGCKRITLDTTQPLKRAIRFYERNGYRPTGKVGDFYGLPLHEYEKQL